MDKQKLIADLKQLKQEMKEETKELRENNDLDDYYDIGYNEGYIGALIYVIKLLEEMK